ncbi:MAG TPA: ATP-binding protein [Anaerolineae bacterium]|nr:ATP-binding protein [Anaerolineae bacterium]
MTEREVEMQSARSPLLEPRSIEETGMSRGFLSDLALKTIYSVGELSGQDIAEQLRLPFSGVVEEALTFLKREQLVSITGSKGFDERAFRYSIASAGIERVREALNRSQYVGPAPVTLEAYQKVMRSQTIGDVVVSRDQVQNALSHLVVNSKMLMKIGPAVNSGRSIFLFGPPGDGKTVIAKAMASMLGGEIVIPYAVEVDGHIIKVFDELNHQAVEDLEASSRSEGGRRDRRWIPIQRPIVVTGGELTLESLDLVYDDTSKFYEAPFQMKANGGMFLIDDFGRQQVRPRDLLNRWIVPLETRVDFLTLHTGKKVEIPFDQLIVFSTNIDPKALVDEAFLRRIRHKIEVGNPSEREFYEIFKRVAAERNVPFDQDGFMYLMREYYLKLKRELRAVHPRDIVDQIIDIAHYRGLEPALTEELIDQACSSYFVEI